MTDQLPQDLTALFEATVSGVEVPPLPLAQTLAEGRSLQRLRRRRTALWSAAAAAVAVVAVTVPVAIASHHHADGPPPAHRTETTSPTPDASGIPTTPTTLPYLAGTTLHTGGTTIPLDAKPTDFISHGDTTLFWDQKTEQWWRVVDGEARPFGPPRSSDRNTPWKGTFSVEVSADGHTIATMMHPAETTTRITEYDAEGQKEIGHVDLDEPFANWTGGGDSVTLTHVANSGQIIWAQTDKSTSWWVWKPSMTAPSQVEDELSGSGDLYPPDAAIAVDDVATTVADDGTTRPDARVPGSAEISSWLWSPSGSFLATMRMATPSHVARPSDDGPALIDIDDGSEPVRPPTAFTILKWFGFESESYVIGAAAVDHTPASLVRCATDRSACAVIGELATGWESWRWATSPPSGDTATDESSATTAAAPNAPVVHGTTLDFDGQTYDVGHRVNLVSAGSTVLIGHWGKQITWRTIRNGQLVPIPYGKGHVPVLNPDGTRAVVSTNPTPQTSRITVYDTSTDAEIDRVDRDLPAICCSGGSIEYLQMDGSGRISWAEVTDGPPPYAHFAWTIGSDPVPIPKPPGDDF